MEKHLLKKSFLISMIISLSISALVGIIIFLIGDFGEIERRILFTTLSIGIYSLIGLGFSALYERKKLILFSFIGLILTVLNFVNSVLIIWEITDNEFSLKFFIISLILGGSFLQASLLLLIKSNKESVNASRIFTFFMIGVVAVLLIILVIEGDIANAWEYYFRILGVAAILDGLGTIVTPIIYKTTSIQKREEHTEHSKI